MKIYTTVTPKNMYSEGAIHEIQKEMARHFKVSEESILEHWVPPSRVHNLIQERVNEMYVWYLIPENHSLQTAFAWNIVTTPRDDLLTCLKMLSPDRENKISVI